MMDRVFRYVIPLAVAAFCALMWGLLIRQHLPRPWASSLQPDYDNLLPLDEQERTTDWNIFFSEQRMGQARTTIARDDVGMIIVSTQSEILLDPLASRFFGATGTLDLDFRVRISPLRGLEYFEGRSALLGANIQGNVLGGQIVLTGSVGKRQINTAIPYDQSSLVSGALSPVVALPPLSKDQIGRNWSLDMVNPVAGQMEKVTVTVVAAKEIELAGRTETVFRLLFAMRGNQWTSWVDAKGNVLVQGSPFGVRLERADLTADQLAALTVAGVAEPARP